MLYKKRGSILGFHEPCGGHVQEIFIQILRPFRSHANQGKNHQDERRWDRGLSRVTNFERIWLSFVGVDLDAGMTCCSFFQRVVVVEVELVIFLGPLSGQDRC